MNYSHNMTEWIKEIYGHAAGAVTMNWIAFAIYIIIGWVASIALGRMQRRLTQTQYEQRQFFSLLCKILKAIVWVLVLVQGLRGIGVDVVSILGAAGVAGVAIGFASQTALSNLISGAFLVSERSFRMGDYIQVGGEEGTVESFNLLSVYLRRGDNTLVRVPCETLIKSPVRNLTGAELRRIDLDIGVDYACDLKMVKEVIMSVITKRPELMNTPAPTVTFSNFGDSSLNLHIGAWCKTAEYHSVRYTFATELLAAFNENGINIPFPIRAVTQYPSKD